MGLPSFTNLDLYYGDSSQFGDYQYVSIETIVNDFIASVQVGDYTENATDTGIIYHAKKGVQELYYDVAQEVIAIELELNPNYTIPIPHDYINYVRISWVDSHGKLHPMAMDKSSNLAQAYLQDESYNYLFDGEGDILRTAHTKDEGPTDTSYTVDGVDSHVAPNYYNAYPFNFNKRKVFKNGSFRINKEKGVIQFSSSLDGRTIVLEYISDGLYQKQDGDIKIHKFCEGALVAWIYFKLIERQRNVPQNEKERAWRTWSTFKRKAKNRLSPLTPEDIRQALRGNSRWIKD